MTTTTIEKSAPAAAQFKHFAVASESIASHPVMRAEVLKNYPQARFNESGRRMNEEETIAFLKGCDGAIVGFEPINDRTLSALPELKTIGKYGAGCETMDFAALKRHGVKFGYTWGANRLAVAELTLCFMLMGLRHVMALNLAMRAGARPRIKNGLFLTNRVVGIHGCGNIGKELVRLLQPFNCKIITYDIKDYADFYKKWNVEPVSHEELLARSEVLTLHIPKTKQTIGLYSRDVLRKMRPGAVLINNCRGGIVDEDALLEQLNSGALMAACFDVFAIEPAQCDKLLAHPNFLASPHIGASTEETRVLMVRAALNGLNIARVVEPEEFYGV